MFILTNENVVFAFGESIEKGVWDNDLSMETYRIKNEEVYHYAVISNFVLYEVEELPADFEPNKYCYTAEVGFYENSDYEVTVLEGVVTEQEIVDSIMEEVSECDY